MTIGVISDTHVYPRGARQVPDEVFDLFRRFKVGLILHAGDINIAPVLVELAGIAPVLAVTGNNDVPDLLDTLPESVEFTAGRFRFAMIHGHGGKSARSEAGRRYAGKVDCVVFGHSHLPLIEREQGTILLNPGSATDRRWGDHFGVALIQVTAEKIIPELVLYQEPRHLKNILPETAAFL